MGQGPNVVADLAVKAKLVPGSEVYVDNLFTSFPLMAEMSARGIGLTGTMRQNCLHSVPIRKKKWEDRPSRSCLLPWCLGMGWGPGPAHVPGHGRRG